MHFEGNDTVVKASSQELAKVDIYSEDVLENPWAFFEELRTCAPVLRHEASGVYQVSTAELVMQVVADHATFSNAISHALHGKAASSEAVKNVMARGYERPATLHTADPPVHTRSRKLVNQAFSPRRVDAMSDQITQTVDELIDKFAARGKCEFLSEFAQPLPLLIIMRQLGVPDAEMERARFFNAAFAAQISQVASGDQEVEAARQIVEFQHYFADMIERKRAEPSDDIISDIANATLAGEGDDTRLEVPEMLQIIQQLLVAGNETTASSLVEGMVFLIQHPEVQELVRDDPQARARAVEEMLRLHTPVQSMWRVALRDTKLGGVTIEKGALVLLRFGSANRDGTIFDDPNTFDIHRDNLKKHLAFGHGIHFCIGAALARREMNIAFERLLRRLDAWQFAADNAFVHRTSILLRGMKRLDLEFSPERTAEASRSSRARPGSP